MANSVEYIIELRDRFSRNIDKFDRKMSVVNKRMKRGDKTLIKFNKRMGEVGKKLTTRLTAPLVAAAGASVFAFAKLEKGMADVFTLLDKAQIAEFGDDLKAAQKEAIGLGFSIDDTNKALFDSVSSLGISEEQITSYRAALKLAIAGNSELGAAVLGIGKIMNVWGKDTSDVEAIINSFFTAQKVGTTTVQDLGFNIGTISGAAKTMGLTFEETLATLSVMTNSLKNTEEAGTALSAILSGLNNPGAQAKKIFDALGITYGITAVKAEGFPKVLKQIAKGLREHPDLLAQAIPNIRAFRGLTNLTEESLSLMDDTVKQIAIDTKAGTGVMEKFSDQMQTTSQRLKQAKGSTTLLLNELGTVLKPLVEKLVVLLIKLVRKFSSLSPAMKKTIVIFAAIAASIGPLLVIFSSFIAALIVMKIAAISLGISLGAAFGIFFIIPAAIIAVIGLLVFLQKKFKIFNKIGSAFSKIKGFASGVFGGGANSPEAAKVSQGNIGSTNTVQSSTVDVSGTIGVEAGMGSKITKLLSSNPDVGLNQAVAF